MFRDQKDDFYEYSSANQRQEKIDAIKKYLLGSGKIRDYTLFVVGINTGLRIADLLTLTWEDVLTEKKKFKVNIYI